MNDIISTKAPWAMGNRGIPGAISSAVESIRISNPPQNPEFSSAVKNTIDAVESEKNISDDKTNI